MNANWSPMAATYPENDVFEAGELQNGNPPYSSNRPAHCQENNMDDTLNLDFSNCPSRLLLTHSFELSMMPLNHGIPELDMNELLSGN